jgi:hypothetical protein
MQVNITKSLKRKTHTPSGERGKTLCGKRIAETVPTTTERPGCKVCAVVYDQSIRGIVRMEKPMKESDREKNFAHGFAFALVQFMRNNGRSVDRDLFRVFDDAGYTLNDFAHAQWDEGDREVLIQIFNSAKGENPC